MDTHQKLSPTDRHLQRKTWFSSVEFQWRNKALLRARPMPSRRRLAQKKPFTSLEVFCLMMLSPAFLFVWLVGLVVYLLYFVYLLLLFFVFIFYLIGPMHIYYDFWLCFLMRFQSRQSYVSQHLYIHCAFSLVLFLVWVF